MCFRTVSLFSGFPGLLPNSSRLGEGSGPPHEVKLGEFIQQLKRRVTTSNFEKITKLLVSKTSEGFHRGTELRTQRKTLPCRLESEKSVLETKKLHENEILVFVLLSKCRSKGESRIAVWWWYNRLLGSVSVFFWSLSARNAERMVK